MHNDAIAPGGIWTDESVPTASRLDKLDQRASESLNGTDGGTWSPDKPIYIGGSGVAVRGDGSGFFGEVRTGRGAVGLVLGNNDYPVFTTPRTRKYTIPASVSLSPDHTFKYLGGNRYGVYNPVDDPTQDVQYFRMPLSDFRLTNGATLAKVTMRASVEVRTSGGAFSSDAFTGGFQIRRTSVSGGSDPLYAMPVWTANTAYNVGDIVRPITPAGKGGRVARCENDGTSHATDEPVWTDFTYNDTIVDAGVIWRIEGQYDFAGNHNETTADHFTTLSWLASATSFVAGGNVQDVVLVPNVNQVIDTETYGYEIVVVDPVTLYRYRYHDFLVELSDINELRAA